MWVTSNFLCKNFIKLPGCLLRVIFFFHVFSYFAPKSVNLHSSTQIANYRQWNIENNKVSHYYLHLSSEDQLCVSDLAEHLSRQYHGMWCLNGLNYLYMWLTLKFQSIIIGFVFLLQRCWNEYGKKINKKKSVENLLWR